MSSGNPETRERILQTAWHLIEGQGDQGVRLGDIAKAAGVSRQALYLHFGSRAELLSATTRYIDSQNKLRERLQPIEEATNGREALKAYLVFWGGYLPIIVSTGKALMLAGETDEAAAAAWNDRMGRVREGCRFVVEKLAAEGELAANWEVETATEAMWTMLLLPNWINYTEVCGWTAEEYTERMTLMLERILIGC